MRHYIGAPSSYVINEGIKLSLLNEDMESYVPTIHEYHYFYDRETTKFSISKIERIDEDVAEIIKVFWNKIKSQDEEHFKELKNVGEYDDLEKLFSDIEDE